METYNPQSRRPIADVFRITAHWCVELCLRYRIHADAVSYGSVVVSSLAAVAFWRSGEAPWLLIPAAALCYLRLWFNMLDGMVALAANQASLRGEILNDLPDRFSDVLIFVGVAHSGWCHTICGYWGAIFALATAYVGLLGQAVGVGRQYQGVMSKPWRMVILHLGAWTAMVLAWRGHGSFAPGGLTILDWSILVMIAGCLQTIAVRLRGILTGLSA